MDARTTPKDNDVRFEWNAVSRLLLVCMLQGCSISAGPEPGSEDEAARDRAAEWAADTAAERKWAGGNAAQSPGSGPSVYSACTGDPLGSSGYCSTSCPCGVNQGDCDSDAECIAELVCMRDTGGLFGWDPEVDTCMAPCAILAGSCQ